MRIGRIQGFEMKRFGGLSMVNLKASKPLYQIVPNLPIPNLYIQHIGGRGYMYNRVCRVSSLSPALLAGRGRGHNKPYISKPLYLVYARHGGYGAMKV